MTKHYAANRGAGAVGIILLLVLLGIVAGVFVAQGRYDRKVFNPQEVLAASLEAGETGNSESSVLAQAGPEGYEPMTAMEVYGPDSLYEKINGKAPLYLDSGFEQLRTQRFVNSEDADSWFELYVYDMGAGDNAFSVYSTQKRLGVRDLDTARYSYETEDAVFAAAGPYYIELIGTGESGPLMEEKRETLANLVSQLNIGSEETGQKEIFPAEGQIAGTVSLSVSSTFGYEEFVNVYTAQYEGEAEPVTLFYTQREDFETARQLGQGYIEFLLENGADRVDTDIDFGEVLDFYGMIEVVFIKGNTVGGVHAAGDVEEAIALAEKLYENVREGSD